MRRLEFSLQSPTLADENMLLLLQPRRTTSLAGPFAAHPHLVHHRPPGNHVLIGSEPGDVQLNVASPGWGKHASSNSSVLGSLEPPFSCTTMIAFISLALMHQMDTENVTSFCAPPTVWRYLIQADLSALKTPRASWSRPESR